MKTSSGFGAKDLDTSVQPQDDFYQYANGGWLKRNPIPKTESRWGSFIMLRYDTDKKLKMILSELLKLRRAKTGTPEQMIGDFFRSGMDMKRRNALGAKPLSAWRKRIEEIKNVENLMDVVADLHVVGTGPLFNTAVDQDAKNTERYILHFFQDGLGMPDRDYYLLKDAENTRVRSAYISHMTAMHELLGYSSREASSRAKRILAIETKLATEQMNKVDRREVLKTYHKFGMKELQKAAPNIDWARYLKRITAGQAKSFIVMQPKYFSAISKLLVSIPLSDWKEYLEWQVLDEYAGALSAPFVKQNFAFYGTTLSGTKHMRPRWRRVLATVNGNLSELIGKIYVQKHFTAHAKKAMEEMVDDLFAAYRIRIKGLDWMGKATKKKALHKLSKMNRKIGYPDKWKTYRGLSIRPSDYFGNIERSARYEHHRQMKKLHGPIDRTEWFMSPQTVNAYNAPNMNEIAFPAAILQPPFFNPDGDAAGNYGAMGAVIAHEISHGFDDEGAKYDAKGNLKNWWTPKDKKRFESKGKLLVRQYNAYEVSDGVKVNGKLTLGENIADLGGAVVAYYALKRHLARHPGKTIRGFSPEQRFFLGFALFERENSRSETEKTNALNDPHAPSRFRINGALTNLEEFYEAFDVKPSHAMYRKPKDRAKIW